jgi:hypothetical protein
MRLKKLLDKFQPAASAPRNARMTPFDAHDIIARWYEYGGAAMRIVILAGVLIALSAATAIPQDRPTKPAPGWVRCSQWCAKCKPDEGCRATCRRSGNRFVHDSCSIRGNG